MMFLIGEDVRVAAAKDKLLLGLKGTVVLETMHTVTIRTDASRKVTLQKLGSALQLSTGKLVLGEEIEGRLEDRIATGSSARKGSRRA